MHISQFDCDQVAFDWPSEQCPIANSTALGEMVQFGRLHVSVDRKTLRLGKMLRIVTSCAFSDDRGDRIACRTFGTDRADGQYGCVCVA